jgi:hypothetical protein
MTEATTTGTTGGETTTGATGATTGATGTTTTGATTVDWTSTLAPEQREVVTAKGWKSPADVLTGYVQIEKTIGLDKLPLPPKDAQGNRDWAKWEGWNALGRPESADKYVVKAPEGKQFSDTDKAFHAAILPVAHAAGLTQAQLDALAEAFTGFTGKQGEVMAAQRAERAGKATEALQQAFGADYTAKVDLAARALRTFGGDDAVKAYQAAALLDEQGNVLDPSLAIMLAKIGDALQEDGQLPGEKRGSGAITTAAGAKAEIARLQASEAYTKPDHPEHAAVHQRVLELYAVGEGEAA